MALVLVGLFVNKGTNFPFGKMFFRFLFSVFPFTGALRNPYEKFGIVFLLPYSIFFALGVRTIFDFLKNGKKKYLFLILTMFLGCGVLVYPIWNGDIFPKKRRLNPPAYYSDTNTYMNSQGAVDNRFFHIPASLVEHGLKYSWGYSGGDPTENLFDFKSLSRTIPYYATLYEAMPNYYESEGFPKLVGFLGGSFILIRNETIHPEFDQDFFSEINDIWEGIVDYQKFGEIDVYKIDNELVRPRIYATRNMKKVSSIREALDAIEISPNHQINQTFVLEDLPFKFDDKKELLPKLRFRKQNETSFVVNVESAKIPFVLVLNNTFNNNWQARINKQVVEKHFVINSFANAWYVDLKGDYEVEIILKVWPWQ